MSTTLTTIPKGIWPNVGMKRQSGAPELSTFADRLALAIEKKGANANKIEVKTHSAITRQAIYAMLSGRTGKPTWEKLVLLCAFLGVRPEWLADGELPMAPAPLLDDSEVELIQAFRRMSAGHQRDAAEILKRWAEEDADAPRTQDFHQPRTRRTQ